MGFINQLVTGGHHLVVADHYLDWAVGEFFGTFPVLNPPIGESTGNVFEISGHHPKQIPVAQDKTT